MRFFSLFFAVFLIIGTMIAAVAQDTQTELSTEEKELDEKILGAWILIAEDERKSPSVEEMTAKLPNCAKTVRVQNLKFENGQERALPRPKLLYGEVFFFREPNGLHRLNTADGSVIRFSKPITETSRGRKLWGMVSTLGKEYRLFFKDALERGGKAKFMLENERVFLKCDFIKQNTSNPESNG